MKQDGIYQEQGIIDTSFDFGSGIGCMVPAVVAGTTLFAIFKTLGKLVSAPAKPQPALATA